MVTLVKPLQFANAPSPILVTELGMMTLVKPLQLLNANLPIEVTELGMVTLVKPVQLRNAWSPILVTENEIPRKVIDSGMVRSPVGLLPDG